MEPKYINENRYSHLVGKWRPAANADYEAKSPESVFEKQVHSLFIDGQAHMYNEEYVLALNAFRELQSLILRTAHPKMPVDPNQLPDFIFPNDVTLVDVFAAKAAEILQKTPLVSYEFPPTLISEDSILPAPVQQKLGEVVDTGLQVKSYHDAVFDKIEIALDAAEDDEWAKTARYYSQALALVPATDGVLRASLLHDLAIINEKLNNRAAAIQNGQESVKLFSEAKLPEAQAHALDTMTGIYTRAGNKELADAAAKQADALRRDNNLHQVVLGRRLEPRTTTLPKLSLVSPFRPIFTKPIGIGGRAIFTPGRLSAAPTASSPQLSAVAATVVPVSTKDAPVLMEKRYVKAGVPQKSIKIQGSGTAATIALSGNATANVKAFLQILSDTQDLGLLTRFWVNPVHTVAYLPHMYFFIIPMAIGDCFIGLGSLKQAEDQYLSVLTYPFINKSYEIVKLWTRLAEVYLERGDQEYRQAKDNIAAFAEAKAAYENIVLTNRTLNANSPLYKDAKFAAIKTRVTNFLATANPVAFDDNPAILIKVLEASAKLEQIKSGLNFFGFAPNYLPPFSFEYLQNTARYFAQQASQIEQRYIQYKSTAENEQLRREQLDQQAEVARQSVVLEQRGVAEAQAGIAVAQAGLNYAEVQRANAVKSQNDFNAVRWELLELAEAEAWASAASMDEDDEIRQSWNGHYYSSSDRRRSQVLQDLAYQRTRISHDLEAKKLQRAIDSANAYRAVAQAQLNQANVRKAIAEQRVKIAQLQQKHAEENRDFLDLQEFNARLWYDLARQARRLTQRYLDMATETAFLMERAYNAETERNLNAIRYDYSQTSTGNLMGADLLLADIDYFTLDHVTTTKTKKIPIKKTVSLADSFAMAFHQLKTEGRSFFQTELADFDRDHPGLYLCKLRNVELVFVGITRATFIAGSLRNVGVSKFRRENGAVTTRLYPSDVMPLSQYDIRQDALAFRFNPNDLRLFENNGIDTLWQLELPLNANDFDYNEILDIQLVLYYDGFFSSSLETTVKAALPTTGAASRAFSMRMMFPDELFYLKNKGDAELVFDADMFPRNETNLQRTDVTLKVSGQPAAISNLKLRLTSAGLGSEMLLTTNANGEVNDSTAGQPLRALRGKPMLDKWTVKITAADNPQLASGGALNLSGINDILAFFEYQFNYR